MKRSISPAMSKVMQIICCLNYSVAKNEYLAAYRFDHERILDNSKIVYV